MPSKNTIEISDTREKAKAKAAELKEQGYYQSSSRMGSLPGFIVIVMKKVAKSSVPKAKKTKPIDGK